MLVFPMLGTVPAIALMLPAAAGAAGVIGGALDPSQSIVVGFAFLASSVLLAGFLNGPVDIAMFTVRQRRTDPAWMGRAFAVSMAANFMGFPIGAAIGGALSGVSLPGTVLLAAVAALGGAVLAALMVPRHDPAGSN